MTRRFQARKLLWLAPALLEIAAIAFLSSRTTLMSMPSILDWDKLQHASAYGVLAGLLRLGFVRGLDFGESLASVTGVIGAAAYGIVDEVHQGFVPGRERDIHDWIADAAGALMGVAAIVLWGWLRAAGKDEKDVRPRGAGIRDSGQAPLERRREPDEPTAGGA